MVVFFTESDYQILKKCKTARVATDAASLAELQGGEAAVDAVFDGLQFRVRAGFHDPSAGDDDDAIHVPHRGEAVGDDKRSAPAHEGFQRFLNQALTF